MLDRDGLNRVEPGLAHASATLAGGLRLPHDETGDCQLFTTRLAELAQELGVQFRYDTPVRRLQLAGGLGRDEGKGHGTTPGVGVFRDRRCS